MPPVYFSWKGGGGIHVLGAHSSIFSGIISFILISVIFNTYIRGDRMVVGFTTTCPIGASHHLNCEIESHWWQDVVDTTLCDIVCQWLATGRRFSPGTPVYSTNKANRHDITEILLKVALNTITLIPYIIMMVLINIFSSETIKLIEHKLFYLIIGWSLA